MFAKFCDHINDSHYYFFCISKPIFGTMQFMNEFYFLYNVIESVIFCRVNKIHRHVIEIVLNAKQNDRDLA